MIVLSCTCGRSLKIPDSMVGKRGKCPACGDAFMIPHPAEGGVPSRPRPHPRAPETVNRTGTIDAPLRPGRRTKTLPDTHPETGWKKNAPLLISVVANTILLGIILIGRREPPPPDKNAPPTDHAAMEESRTRLEAARNALASSNATADELRTSLESMTEEHETLQNRYETALTDLDRLHRRNSEMEDKMGELQNRLNQRETTREATASRDSLSATRAALENLGRASARFSAGISYRDYSTVHADAIYAIERFKRSGEGNRVPEISALILDMETDLRAISTLWSTKFNNIGSGTTEFTPLPRSFVDRYGIPNNLDGQFGYYIDGCIPFVMNRFSESLRSADDRFSRIRR